MINLLYIIECNIILLQNLEESTLKIFVGPEKGRLCTRDRLAIYLELVYLVTAFVPSLTACLANSPGNRSLTAVCISREVIVERLL